MMIKNYIYKSKLYANNFPIFICQNPLNVSPRKYLTDRIDNIINGSSLNDNLPKFISDLFNNNNIVYDILEIAKAKSTLSYNTWNVDINNLIEKIHNAPIGTLSSRQWKDLNIFACRFGLHRVGYACRQKAINILYEKGIDYFDLQTVCDLFTAAMELGDFETAKIILDKRLNGWRKYLKQTKEAQLSYSLFCDIPLFKINVKRLYRNEDIFFANYIKDKRIAIVGPAKPTYNQGLEIDKFDIIIRINYQGESYTAPEKVGNRTDVSYYSRWIANRITEVNNIKFLYDLSYVVHKSPSTIFHKEYIRERSVLWNYRMNFVNNSLNMIPVIVLDLIAFDVSEIKIFNTNFYLAEEAKDANYNILFKDLVNTDKTDNEFVRAISVHDQLTQINLIRNLWKSGWFAVDNNLDRILKMSNEEIMSLYEIYFPYTWKYDDFIIKGKLN